MHYLNTSRQFIKSSNDEHAIIAGYASTFNRVDKSKHIVTSSTFSHETLNKKIPILFQHNFKKPLGVVLNARIDSHGLYVEACLELSNQMQRDVFNLVQEGEIHSMSVGMKIIKSSFKNGILIIHKAKLVEISLTANPVNVFCKIGFCERFHMVGDSGLEPPTSTMST